MSLSEKLNEIDLKKKEIDILLPLDSVKYDAFWNKIRLEWNYNSNHIEGNTLTYKETALLLIFDQTNGGHTLREFQEMKAHDVALRLVIEWAKSERKLTEGDIRELNKKILVEQFWKEAITEEGLPTQILIEPGIYKKLPNHVKLTTGEVFKYAEPLDVPPLMTDLLDWYYLEDDLHAIQKAAMLHYKFIRIHPFGDGNGRIARLLMNFHLLKMGIPPVVIKSIDKKNYLQALRMTDVGYKEAFVEYIADQTIWSLDLMLKAAMGESLEEEDDWIKELEQLKKVAANEPVKRTNELLEKRLLDSIGPAIIAIYEELNSRFESFFDSKVLLIKLENEDISTFIKNKYLEKLVDKTRVYFPNKTISIQGHFQFKNYQKNNTNVFDVELKFEFVLEEFSYTFNLPTLSDSRIRKKYDDVFNQEDINIMKSRLGKFLVDQIKRHLH